MQSDQGFLYRHDWSELPPVNRLAPPKGEAWLIPDLSKRKEVACSAIQESKSTGIYYALVRMGQKCKLITVYHACSGSIPDALSDELGWDLNTIPFYRVNPGSIYCEQNLFPVRDMTFAVPAAQWDHAIQNFEEGAVSYIEGGPPSAPTSRKQAEVLLADGVVERISELSAQIAEFENELKAIWANQVEPTLRKSKGLIAANELFSQIPTPPAVIKNEIAKVRRDRMPR